MLDRITGRGLLIAAVLLLVLASFTVFTGGPDDKTATLHFERTVSIYDGSEVRVMGVRIGTVTSVVPQGGSVKVEVEYDGQFSLPKGAKAAIVTPTLVADRFVQIAPAYTRGAKLADGGEIPLADSATPVELDRIYQSLSDLTVALGPNGANKDGALNTLLTAGTKALQGNGALGNQTIKNLSAAVETFGNNSGPLFDSVRNLSQLTGALAANDQFVNQFMGDLTSVSAQLAGERDDLAKALNSLANALGTVKTFVRDNKDLLVSDVRKLTDVVATLAKEKKSLDTFSRLGALGLQNLSLAFDVKTGSIGSRVQFGPTLDSINNVLCDLVTNAAVPNAATVCQLINQVAKPILDAIPNVSGLVPPSEVGLTNLGGSAPPTNLKGLLDALGRR